MVSRCETCDTAAVRNGREAPYDIDVGATTDALIARVADGRLRYVRGDVALEDMVALAESDMKYTIVSFLECAECGRTRFWGLSIRGAPVYKVYDSDGPDRWRWDPVPPREKWAR